MILFEGPSAIDGTPIVAIATTGSTNRKTGDMAQVWILPANAEPHKAKKSGAAASVCGDCALWERCYVAVFQAPLAVYRAYRRGRYGEHKVWSTPTRWGAWGDPAALPIDVVEGIDGKRTGYTHRWRRLRSPRWKRLLMASVEDRAGAALATRRGWRYFRVATRSDAELAEGEVMCPAYSHGTQCADCLLCDGKKGEDDRRANVVIVDHGPKGDR